MSYDAAGAIEVLQNGLKGPRPQSFRQADGLVRLGDFNTFDNAL